MGGCPLKNSSTLVMRKFVALLICFFAVVFLLAETYVVLTRFIPYISILMFQDTGITVADGLTFSEFSVGDFIVMCMMWLFPVLCCIALVCAAQWKVICFVVRKLIFIWKVASRKSENE